MTLQPEPRIPPTPAAEWAPELRAFITQFQATVRRERTAGSGPSGANLLGTLARYPALTTAFLAFNGHLLYGSTLTGRQRELLILRVAWVRRCDYEWAQHVFQGQVAGLADDEIERASDGPDAPGWTASDRYLLKAADELLEHDEISDETWEALAAELSDDQLIDIVFTVGTYEMLAKAMRTFRIQLDADLVKYLPARH